MPYYKTCEKCGANLDPGENCNCQDFIVQSYLYLQFKITDKGACLKLFKSEEDSSLTLLNIYKNEIATEMFNMIMLSTNNQKMEEFK